MGLFLFASATCTTLRRTKYPALTFAAFLFDGESQPHGIGIHFVELGVAFRA